MKIFFLFHLLMSMSALSFAQQKPSSSPNPTARVHSSSSTTSTYEHSISHSDENNKNNLSITISESKNFYKLQTTFPKENDSILRYFLLNEFGKENLKRDGMDWEWTLVSDGEEIYSINFTSGKLRMNLDKEQAATTLNEKFVHAGQQIKQLLSDEDNHQQSDVLERKVERLQRDAQRMEREAARLERKDVQISKKADVRALKMKAESLQQKVDSLQRVIQKLKENN